MNKKKGNLIFGVIVIGVVVLIIGIMYFNGYEVDEDILKCIAEQSRLYVSKTCSHCAAQKQILGSGLKYFELIDCAEDAIACIGITAVPTWEINGERTAGVKNIAELKELTGC